MHILTPLYRLSVFVIGWLCSRDTKGEWNNEMVCKGICVRHKAMKPIGTGRYSMGQKRCQVCEIFLEWDGLWCPCCGYRLRTRPRNSKFKAELRAKKNIEEYQLLLQQRQRQHRQRLPLASYVLWLNGDDFHDYRGRRSFWYLRRFCVYICLQSSPLS